MEATRTLSFRKEVFLGSQADSVANWQSHGQGKDYEVPAGEFGRVEEPVGGEGGKSPDVNGYVGSHQQWPPVSPAIGFSANEEASWQNILLVLESKCQIDGDELSFLCKLGDGPVGEVWWARLWDIDVVVKKVALHTTKPIDPACPALPNPLAQQVALFK